jgi:hypothetical protein
MLIEFFQFLKGRLFPILGLGKVEENPYKILPKNPLKLLGKSMENSRKRPKKTP